MNDVRGAYQEYLNEIFEKEKRKRYNFNNDFHEGLCLIQDQETNLYGFMDKTGKVVIPCKYESALDFSDGTSVCFKDGKYFVIDKEGNTLVKPRKEKISSFSEGLALIYNDEEKPISFIDKSGNEIIPCSTTVKYDPHGFQSGFCVVTLNNKENAFLNKDGEIINTGFKGKMGSFSKEGLAVITELEGEYKTVIINSKNEVVTKFKFNVFGNTTEFENGSYAYGDKIEFNDGVLKVNDEGYLLIENDSIKGYGFSGFWGSYLHCNISEGLVFAYNFNTCKYGFYNIFDKKVAFYVSKRKEYNSFSDGLALFKDEYYKKPLGYIDKRGKVIITLDQNVVKASNFKEGLAFIHTSENRISFEEEQYFIDKNGNKVIYNDSKKMSLPKINYEKNLFGYSYDYNGFKVKIKHLPLYDYGNLVLSISDSEYYLFNKTTNQYFYIEGTHKKFAYGKNYIVADDKTYYLDENEFKEIDMDMSELENIKLKSGYTLYSFEEFKRKYEKDSNFTLKEKQKHLESELCNKNEEAKKQGQDINMEIKNLSERLNVLFSMYNKMKGYTDKNNVSKNEIALQFLLLDLGEHKEINSIFLLNNGLQFVDLSLIDFTGVKVSGIDFSKTNANIDPQVVYNKDMSNGVYSGLSFNLKNFDGVNICGSDFTGCVMDLALNLENAIKDENTILPDIKVK